MKTLLALLLVTALRAAGADVHVAWDKPPDYLTLKGYNLWVGTNGTEYGYYVPIAGRTNTTATLILDVAITYWVGVESVSTNGMMSEMSDVLVIVPPSPPLNLRIVLEQGLPGGVWAETTNIFDIAVFPVEQTNLFFRAKLQVQ